MKKLLIALAAVALLAACDKKNTNEPTPQEEEFKVSTEPTNRIVVVEEYTGINCGYCPDGHKVVNNLMEVYPGKVFGVNIHTGTYAANTYTTNEGAAYAGEASIGGYPAGCINRHVISEYSQDKNGGMAMGRGYFKEAAKSIMQLPSPVNIAAKAEIEQATRTLTVKVKGYFTAEQIVTSNKLYVMILQDSVLGKQNGSSYNPDQVVDGQYRHMHMLRKTLPETWGDEITPLTVGTYFDKEYTYEIPEQLGIKGIDAVLKDLKILVFIAEGHKEILTACEPKMVLK